jgi:hypothetical protein
MPPFSFSTVASKLYFDHQLHWPGQVLAIILRTAQVACQQRCQDSSARQQPGGDRHALVTVPGQMPVVRPSMRSVGLRARARADYANSSGAWRRRWSSGAPRSGPRALGLHIRKDKQQPIPEPDCCRARNTGSASSLTIHSRVPVIIERRAPTHGRAPLTRCAPRSCSAKPTRDRCQRSAYIAGRSELKYLRGKRARQAPRVGDRRFSIRFR